MRNNTWRHDKFQHGNSGVSGDQPCRTLLPEMDYSPQFGRCESNARNLVWCCKILFGIVDVQSDNFFSNLICVLLEDISTNITKIVVYHVWGQPSLANLLSMCGNHCLIALISVHFQSLGALSMWAYLVLFPR